MSQLSSPQTDTIGQQVIGGNPDDFLVIGPTELLSTIPGIRVNKTVLYNTAQYTVANDATTRDLIAGIVAAGAQGSQSVVGSANISGRKYKVTLFGFFSVALAGATLDIEPMWGSTSVGISSNVLTTVTGNQFKLEVIFDFKTINASTGVIRTASFGNIGSIPATQVGSLDTTATASLILNATWSVADPDNSITVEQMYIETIG